MPTHNPNGMSKRPLAFVVSAGLAGLLAAPGVASAVMLGHRDDFQNGLQGSWVGGSANTVPTSGGPAGAGDAYLRMVATGGGSGGKMTMHNNSSDWVGNYTAAGITRIEMDLKNFTSQTLMVRIGLKAFNSRGAPGFCTSNAAAFSLVNDNQWHHAVFNLVASDMTQIGSLPGNLATLLSGGDNGFQELRILHSATPTLQGAIMVGQMGIDNITATPAPGAAGLGLVAAGLVGARRRRR